MTIELLDVLLVEREAAVASVVSRALERRGHRVRTATSGADALLLPVPQVLVADLRLEDMTGFDLLAGYTRRGPAPRTVFVASAPTPEEGERARALGVYGPLAKPLHVEELVRFVEGPDAALPSLVPTAPEGASFRETYRSVPRSVEQAARDVAAFALRNGVGPACRARIASAVCELVENAALHAYPADAPGVVIVEARMGERDCVVVVRDRGIGMDTATVATERMHSSMHDGLARVAALCEGLDLRSAPGHGVVAEVTFGVYRADFDEPNTVDLSELDYFTPDTAREVLRVIADDAGDMLQLSPALAVLIGRLLAGPDPKRVLSTALWS